MTGRPHWAVKPDANQAKVIADLEKLGMVVWRLSDLGGEVLDLMVFWKGICLPVEVKQPGHEADLTDAERESIQALSLVGIQAIVATCAEDVVERWPSGPRWQVVDEAALGRMQEAFADVLGRLAALTKLNWKTKHRKEMFCKLRDTLLVFEEEWYEAIQYR